MKEIFLSHSVQWTHTPYFSLQIHTNGTLFIEMWNLKYFTKTHQLYSVIKDFWPKYKLIKLCSIWWNSMKKSFYPILCNEDTHPTFRSRSTQMALCFLKCEIRSILLKRHQVDSVGNAFCPTNKLIKLCSIRWISMKNSFYPILCNEDTRPTFHSRCKEMALRFLKCEIISILLKRKQVDSVIKDFWPT